MSTVLYRCLLCLACACLLSACAFATGPERERPWRAGPTFLDAPARGNGETYSETAMKLVEVLDAQAVQRLGIGPETTRGMHWLVVTTPADLENLGASSQLGRLMAEELASALNAKGWVVQEIRKGKDVVFTPQGEFMLSRDANDLPKRQAMATVILVATYAHATDGVRFSAKLVDAKNNDVLAQANRTLPMTKGVAAMSRTTIGESGQGVQPSVDTSPDHRSFKQHLPYVLLP